jgi:hypothetical protein
VLDTGIYDLPFKGLVDCSEKTSFGKFFTLTNQLDEKNHQKFLLKSYLIAYLLQDD